MGEATSWECRIRAPIAHRMGASPSKNEGHSHYCPLSRLLRQTTKRRFPTLADNSSAGDFCRIVGALVVGTKRSAIRKMATAGHITNRRVVLKLGGLVRDDRQIRQPPDDIVQGYPLRLARRGQRLKQLKVNINLRERTISTIVLC